MPGEFEAIGILEEMDPPPPVPSAVCKHIFRISLPNITEYLVHANPTKLLRGCAPASIPNKQCYAIPIHMTRRIFSQIEK